MGRPPTPVVQRLLGKVDRQPGDGCWLWTGSTRQGYGQIRVKRDGTWTVRDAHRVAWEELVGPVPAGLVIDHLCRVTTCVNPAHLEPVTQRENVQRGDSPALTALRNRTRSVA